MRFEEFLEKVKAMGGVDTDGYYGKQCMDLYNYYCNNVLGIQNVGAECAKNILKNQNILNAVEVIENYPEFIVQKGDIVVFRNIGQYGHVAICLGPADLMGFKCIEQNWSNTRRLEEIWHDYLYGNPVFLRPKNQENIKEEFHPYNVIITADVLNVREGSGLDCRIKRYTELTPNAQEQIKEKCGYCANGLVKNCEATILEEKNGWGRIPSGWIWLEHTKRV